MDRKSIVKCRKIHRCKDEVNKNLMQKKNVKIFQSFFRYLKKK